MQPTVVQIPLAGLILALVVIAAIIAYLLYMIQASGKKKDQDGNEEAEPKPFSEPRPGPEPVPPVRMPANPVVPMADPKIRPTRYAYDQRYFERCYIPCNGKVEKIYKEEMEQVQKGELLMQIICGDSEMGLKASASGILRELHCEEGMSFRKDDLLYVIQ